MSQEQLEEYLETIFDIAGRNGTAKTSAIANKLHISPASVTEYIQNLASKGLIDYEPYCGARLTIQGLSIVNHLKRRHRLLEVFLSDILQIDPDKVHDEACRMEHYMSDETANALCRWLEAPSRSPHGKPIGPCDKPLETCQRCEEINAASFIRTSGENEIVPVTDLRQDQEGEIVFIRGDQKDVQNLSNLGITSNTRIKVVRKSTGKRAIDLIVGKKTLSVTDRVADNIFVKPV